MQKKTARNILTKSINKIFRGNHSVNLDSQEIARGHASTLRTEGIVVIENFVSSDSLKFLQAKINQALQINMDFQTPCLAQSLIDPKKHKDLIESKFLMHPGEIASKKLAFFDEDKVSYDQVLQQFQPSTLTMEVMNDIDFVDLLLHEEITSIVEEFFDFTPVLKEAYLRRNFKSHYPVMNHCWHRDSNSEFLLKAFILLSDCSEDNGPHHYIKGSIHSPEFREKRYFLDEEISSSPNYQENLFVGTLKAGTLIIEDTRGLHKAGMPVDGFRDMAYAVFTPKYDGLRDVLHQENLYPISHTVLSAINRKQSRYIPSK
jgi:hypothetical protein